MPQDDSWWPETNGHDIGSQLVSRFEPIEDTQDDEQKDIEVGVEGKKFEREHYMEIIIFWFHHFFQTYG